MPKQAKVVNMRLLDAISAAGYNSVAEFARSHKIGYFTIQRALHGRRVRRLSALNIGRALGVEPKELQLNTNTLEEHELSK